MKNFYFRMIQIKIKCVKITYKIRMIYKIFKIYLACDKKK